MTAPENLLRKPKLVFFQCSHERLPEFLVQHARDHVDCLSQFFDTTVVNSDCNYLEVCEKHEPDVALFELGVNHASCRRPRVSNLTSCSSVPKLALHNADAFCNARAGFLSDLDRYGIATVFAIATTAAEHTPELADHLFVWPNCIDPALFKDYGQYKTIPILLTGNKSALYPWRQRVTRLLTSRYPVLNCPHPGYEPDTFRGLVLRGERYARTINASALVPACGTVAKEIIRKHFEVPACRACLVTERSPSLEAAGFVDMQNCVFAEPGDIVDKLDQLLSNPDELQRITDAGYELVHARHTLLQRNQIFQWLELHRKLQPGERIVQPGPFASLCIASPAAPDAPRQIHVQGRGMHLQLIEEGDRHYAAGDISKAAQRYAECINYMPWMPEPRVRLALCRLREGRPTEALAQIKPLLAFILGVYKAADPDPVEWACYILCLLCLGKLKEAARRAHQFEWVHHPELDDVRRLVNALRGEPCVAVPESYPQYHRRRTIHVLPARTWPEWAGQVTAMLKACGQHGLAGRVPSVGAIGSPAPSAAGSPSGLEFSQSDGLLRTGRRGMAMLRLRQRAARALHQLESSCGPFLPFRFSILRRAPLYQSIHDIAREAQMGSALIVGAAVGKPCTEAFLAGAFENVMPPAVYCLAESPRRGVKLRRSLAAHPAVRWKAVHRTGVGDAPDWCDDLIARVMETNCISAFDAVLVDGAFGGSLSIQRRGVAAWLEKAKWVFLNDINSEPNWSRHQWLLRRDGMHLLQVDAGLRGGHSIFHRAGSWHPDGGET